MKRISRHASVWFGLLVGFLVVVDGFQLQPSATNLSPRVARTTGRFNLVVREASAVQAGESLPSPTLISRYCVACHNQRAKTAGLVLEGIGVEDAAAHAEILEKIVRKLRTGAMPPAGAPQPDKAMLDAFVSRLEDSLDRAAAANPNPGRSGLHRLNRVEYANAIRDLLGLDIDGLALLPAETPDFGFDNIADALSVSPSLIDRYLAAARKISRLAVGDVRVRPGVARYSVSLRLEQDRRMSDELPFGSRGGVAIRHYFPLDGEYVIRVRLLRSPQSPRIHGLSNPDHLDIRIDGVRVRLADIRDEAPKPPPYTVAGTNPQGRAAIRYGITSLTDERVLPDPTGRLSSAIADVDETSVAPDWDIVVPVPVKAGARVIGLSFPERRSAAEGLRPDRMPIANYTYFQDGPSARIGVGAVEIRAADTFVAVGPPDTPSRRQIFVCRPGDGLDDRLCARRVLTALAQRAYRRPVTAEDVRTLLQFYDAGRASGGFDAGIENALERILVAPDFLFRIEGEPVGSASEAISDLDLASRLSFFLWSSIPDDDLLQTAIRGNLRDGAVLEQQVRRMLRDDRAKALATNFGAQWLQMRNLVKIVPDTGLFPEFDDNLRQDFVRETELFLESQLQQDSSVFDVVSADYTFLNERLARHYGVPGVHGDYFRRVTIGDGSRGGVLSQGSILMITSYANRTSPVLRGKWVMETLLGAPPPPPPPNVPALTENDEQKGKPTSVRERLEQHRKNPVCASCHASMDPLGFALENFDAIGRWRTRDAGSPIDASGALPDGTHFVGPQELRALLAGRRHDFMTTITEKLLTYALGRGIGYRDMPAIRQIVRATAAADDRWSSLILNIVRSTPFRLRRSES